MLNLKKLLITYTIFISITGVYCFELKDIELPPNFHIEVLAENLKSPRGLTVSEDDTIFVGSKSGKVYKITPDRKILVIAEKLNGPIGIDYHKGDLFVSEIDRIQVFRDILKQDTNFNSEIFISSLPDKKWHGWKYIKVGNDNKLYINIGAPCNTCITENYYGSILKIDLSSKEMEIYAKGVRNSVGFDWHPKTGEFWFTDNGADSFGDNIPADELNRAKEAGQHFGFPYLHGKDFKDPVFNKDIDGLKVTTPELELPAHVAPLGMRFYTGKMFPSRYRDGIFIAEHGSWDRKEKIGYRISFIQLKENRAVDYEIFAAGWLQKGSVYGRPVDIEILSDGSIIISDDFSGKIYRIFI